MRRVAFAAWPLTPMVKRILIINGVIWLIAAILEKWVKTNVLVEWFALIPSEVVPWMAAGDVDYFAPGAGAAFPKFWQVFTWMWLHSASDYFHILFNSLFFWMFGGHLEQAWGPRAFLRFYLICGIGSGLIVLFFGLLFAPGIPVVGASGAVYGLIAAWGIHSPNKRIYFFGVLPLKVKHFSMILVGFALADFLTRARGVSHAAHLGGMLVGALLVTGYWRPDKTVRQLRYWWLRRKLRVIEGNRDKEPPGGGYWH